MPDRPTPWPCKMDPCRERVLEEIYEGQRIAREDGAVGPLRPEYALAELDAERERLGITAPPSRYRHA